MRLAVLWTGCSLVPGAFSDFLRQCVARASHARAKSFDMHMCVAKGLIGRWGKSGISGRLKDRLR